MTSEIEVNGDLYVVPLSSEQALARMRRRHHSRRLWIDGQYLAICIDQSNPEERAEQISIMNEIYGSSAGNLIYLGEADASTQAAFDSVRAIALEIQAEVPADHDFADSIYNWGDNGFNHPEIPFHKELDWQALACLFARPYFS